jgi:Ca2+-binding EF-hand superfamily protein
LAALKKAAEADD